MARAYWEHFDHGADIGVRGFGSSLADAFAQAALALTAVIADPASVRPEIEVTVTCAAPDDEILLVDWLNALVFEMAERQMLFGRHEVRIEDHRLRATSWGEAIDIARHHPAVEVKGATMTALSVRRENGGWRAECVVDV